MFSGGLAFLNKEEDDFDNFPAGVSSEKSNLADIFEANDEPEKSNLVNPTLKYIAPKSSKQPNKKTEKTTWNVQIAKIVGAFKLVNDENTSLGQLGFAMLSTEDSSKLILYKTKDQILSTLLLNKSSTVVFWKPPYFQYHDDVNSFWSLLFGSDADSNEFFAKLEKACVIDRANINKPDNTNETKTKTTELQNDKNDGFDPTSIAKTKTKSDVVYRVAKIGHQLPKMKPVTDDDDDDNDNESGGNESNSTTTTSNLQKIKVTPENQIPKPSNISTGTQPADFNTFATENRIQQAEVRLNLSKLDSKLDRVLDNIERLRLNSLCSADIADKEEEMIKLEEKLLDLKKENRLLKLQLAECDQGKKETNDKEKEELLAVQKSNDEKTFKIAELTSNLQDLEQKLEAKEKENAELTEKYTAEVESIRKEFETKKIDLNEVPQQEQQQNNSKTEGVNNGDIIRGIMNQFYVKLYQSVEGKETMSSADILKLTADIIRKETKSALNSI